MPLMDPTHPDFPHGRGTHSQYRACRCEVCKAAVAKYARELRRKNMYGLPVGRRLVDAMPARMHLRNLYNQGYSLSRMSREFGVSTGALSMIMNGKTKLMRYENLVKILYHDVTTIPSKTIGRVDAAPYREHLRRLGANGWSGDSIAKLCGFDGYDDMYVFREATTYLLAENARKLGLAFAEIGDQVGPSKITMNYWRNKGWLPPIAYDEDDLPDWRAVPDLTERQKLAVQKRRRELLRTRREEDEDGIAV